VTRAPAAPPAGVVIAAPADAGAAVAIAMNVIDAPPPDAPAAPIDAPAAPIDARPVPKVVAVPPVARPSGPPGYVTIDSSPVYAVIYIDGKSYGETPLVKLALPPGRHSVHAVAPSGATRDVRITIESGKVAPVSRIEW
jgi:hypothetical protein